MKHAKRGISDVVSTVLIILLVVAAIAIVGGIILRIASNASESVETSTSTISFSVTPASVIMADSLGTTKYVSFALGRNAGAGNLNGVQVILKDSKGITYSQRINTSIKELETKRFEMQVPGNLADVASLSIVPIFLNSRGREAYGNLPSTTTIDKQTAAAAIPVPPANGWPLTQLSTGSFVYAPAGIVSYYKLEGSYVDALGINNGTCSGSGCPVLTTGKIGSGYSFDGSNDVITVNPYQLDSNLTVSFWFKPAEVIAVSRVIEHNWISGQASGGSFTTHVFDTRVGAIVTGGTSGNYQDYSLQTSQIISPNQWYHMAVSYNGTLVALYVNGTLQTSAQVNRELKKQTQPLYIGSGKPGTSFNGVIDEVMMFNKGLNASDIAQLYSLTANQ